MCYLQDHSLNTYFKSLLTGLRNNKKWQGKIQITANCSPSGVCAWKASNNLAVSGRQWIRVRGRISSGIFCT